MLHLWHASSLTGANKHWPQGIFFQIISFKCSILLFFAQSGLDPLVMASFGESTFTVSVFEELLKSKWMCHPCITLPKVNRGIVSNPWYLSGGKEFHQTEELSTPHWKKSGWTLLGRGNRIMQPQKLVSANESPTPPPAQESRSHQPSHACEVFV